MNRPGVNPIKPRRLHPGDTIGIVTPASPMIPERLANGIAYLRARGYNVVEGEHVYAQRGYLAGTDAERAADLNRMFADPDIKAVICSRGGYGVSRLLDQVDYEALRQHPKIFVGYSDLTALQLAIWQRIGLVTFSGPMVAVEMGKGIHPFTEGHFWRMLTSDNLSGPLPHPEGKALQCLRPGKARGRLLGGCLSLIAPLMGTPFMPALDGAILVLEDIDEEVYRIDRYFAQFRSAGILDKIAGLVFGTFINWEPSEPDKPYLTLEQVIDDYVSDLPIPVATGLAYGHGEAKITLPIGLEAELDADAGTLTILEPAVV
ncbi:MAG: LD-carboxypeptidase [candidate division KSB1 bacterium]|nr:LD-carboxypeptidase [candidate division KSB1 bacterium]